MFQKIIFLSEKFLSEFCHFVRLKGTVAQPEVGIYKRKQENKKTRKLAFEQERSRKNALDRESDSKKENDNGQEKKERKHALYQESDQEKKNLFS